MTILDVIKTVAAVEQVKQWQDRYYVNLTAARGSRANADLRTKIWAKGDILTIESGKGYHSDAYISGKHELIEAVKAAGYAVREV